MMKASLIGSILSNIIYVSLGLIGYIMYKDNINDSLIRNFGEELTRGVTTCGILLFDSLY